MHNVAIVIEEVLRVTEEFLWVLAEVLLVTEEIL